MKYIFLLSACVTTFTAAGQWQKFSGFTSYTVEKQVNLFHLKDMDGDQLPDIVNFYNASENKFSILKGKANGNFAAEHTISKPVNYHLSDIADLNKDGYNDLVISSYWDNGFRVFLGNSTGSYSESGYFGVSGHGKQVKCVDINKDGSIDILFTSSGSGQAIILYVYLNKGNGSFEPVRSFPSMLDTSKEIMITDKNNDGLLDVVVSSSFAWLLFYFQQPDGSFEAKYLKTNTTAYTAFKDLDHDNKEDMIMLYPSFENTYGSDSIIIKRNLGGDLFSTSVRIPSFENKKIQSNIICLADINNDGEQDIVLNHLNINYEYTDTAYYMLGKGNLVFDEPIRVIMPGKVVKMQLVDINSDNFPDWVVSCTNNIVAVALNKTEADNIPSGEVRLYPNPSDGKLFIDRLANEQYNALLYNTTGNLVKQFKITGPSASIDIKYLSAGLYFIELKNRKQKLVRKLVKQ